MSDKISIKHDSEKPMMELLPSAALMEVAKILSIGAKKYSKNNWRDPGFDYTRILGAAHRHLHLFNDGEDLDPETKLSHVAHAACNVLFLLEHILKGYGKDDRFKKS